MHNLLEVLTLMGYVKEALELPDIHYTFRTSRINNIPVYSASLSNAPSNAKQ